jgi:hypothetical protein
MKPEPPRIAFAFGPNSYWHLCLDPELAAMFNWRRDPDNPDLQRAYMNGATPCPACGSSAPHIAHRALQGGQWAGMEVRASLGVVCWSSEPFVADGTSTHKALVDIFRPRGTA